MHQSSSSNINRQLKVAIQTGLVILVAIMPFHAFLSVWLGSITQHEAIIQAWKEVLLLILSALAVILVSRDAESRDRLRTWPVGLAGAFAVVALVVSALTRPSSTAVLFGAKTDLEFLVAFVLAIIASTPNLVRNLTGAVLVPACAVVAFGLLQIKILPPNFLTHFGYGPTTIMPYETLSTGAGTLRFASTLGGPNQLGTYLILPLALALILSVRRRQWWWLALVLGDGIVLIHTYSRGAWLGAVAAVIVIVLVLTPSNIRLKAAGALTLIAALAVLIVGWLLGKGSNLRAYIFHGNNLTSSHGGSDYQHLNSLQLGLMDSLYHPLGHGLGTAGPAVFHSGTGIIIENNFLQISYEAGLLGAALFVAILFSLSVELARRAARVDLAAAALAGLIGVSITALFLPAWTDSSTALILWAVAGCAVGLSPDTRHV